MTIARLFSCYSPSYQLLIEAKNTMRDFLIDAGNSPAHAALFRKSLQRLGARLPDLLILTHWHWDHTFGMST
ncbi:MBL fold metallo-hydrolase [Brevibacillus brevis]|uniref:MBL fold metallo-hydrolase n=1 Tax=Brevibacillus brevis TaxID=1393 RepID=UPI00277D0DA7|nr:MBL fold metallo-hydrolase [Brevibacillus brevis]